MRILAFGAHPDDIEYLCAGTLAHCAARGDEIAMAIFTNGEVGYASGEPADIAERRRIEAKESALIVGAETFWLGYQDEMLFSTRDTRLSCIDVLRASRPDLVIAPSSLDYHPDHRTAGQIVLDSIIPASARLLRTRFDAVPIPSVIIMDTVDAVGFVPDAYVDISNSMATKTQMLGCHQSQREFMQFHYGEDFELMMTRQSRARGAEVGVAYAEAFQLLRTYPPGNVETLLPLITGDVPEESQDG